jgi:hypothetical protein
MVVRKYSIICLCDFPQCKEKIFKEHSESWLDALYKIRENGWNFTVKSNRETIVYCPTHKYELIKR